MKFGLLLYPGVEPIDLATIGVISMARRIITQLEYVTLASESGPLHMSNGLRVLPDHDLEDAPRVDVLIVPGGPGWTAACDDQRLIDYISATAPHCTVLSVCTGAMLLARAGVLEGKRATTKVEVVPPEQPPLQVLSEQYPQTTVDHALIVDEGRVITGGGVSLCIDAMLYLLGREFGADAAAEVARIIEYGSAHTANRARLAVIA